MTSSATLIMPRQTADAQLIFRAEQAMKVELEAIAKTLDYSSAKLLRDVLAEALPRLRARAEEEVRRKERLPHGITPDALEKALAALIRKFAAGDPVRIDHQDLLGPESKALWVLLTYLWGEVVSEDDRRAVAGAIPGLRAPPKPRK